MKIAVIGTGYVGLVTGTCLADSGNTVTCIDIDEEKINSLAVGRVPIYEPGLAELVRRNADRGRLRFTTDTAAGVRDARLIFLAVGTPSSDDGAADLTSLWIVVDALAPHFGRNSILVIKSTVPVGTNAAIYARLNERTGRECDVASNPEFLKEGAAIEDFKKPDRVVVGVRREEVAEVLHELYRPFLRTERPFLVMSPESAEMTKYVANSLLATKISFINEVANLCERTKADINEVRRGIGHDQRIGFAFLFPGVGYGGSCFPKDVRALVATARHVGQSTSLLEAVDAVNQRQKEVLLSKIACVFGDNLAGKRIAVWGLAFKPRTDDVREAPALVLVDALLARGAVVAVHDPEATANVHRLYGDRLTYAEQPYDALTSADALAICTEWEEYRNPDFTLMRERMKTPVIFDGRNLYEPDDMRAEGFAYHSIGRASVTG
ncbi:MAG: UDP-glucose/GDP-mannose dehydrogenase family protein [Pirellulales bacterium]|nr:UDP-glucose/GDP-mannose dehydrogenase family protein [Pirellulales bacterium]